VIALDTNVLVRFIVDDDPSQTAMAAAMIDRAGRRGVALFVPQIVLCELVWVLSFAYRFSRKEIVGALNQLRRAAQITVEGADEVRRAIEEYHSMRGDFSDYLIAERAIANGCTAVATFDRALLADARFMSPSAV
jgi:predicted nucleic-acid-binding protein